MALTKITKKRYQKVCDLYFLWKELNSKIKEDYSRGINLPEALTEPICCYVNDFLLSTPDKEEKENSGSEDAINPRTHEQVQIKASSNWNRDLTSFGPRSNFSSLHFVRLEQSEDKMYLYEIPVENLKDVQVNKKETYGQQQKDNKRPRFSVIKKYIVPDEIEPYAVVDLETTEITYIDN